MKQYLKWAITGLTLLAMIAFSLGSTFAQSGEGRLRFVHAIPGASAIDIYTDGQLTISGLNFGDASTYVHVPAGSHQLTVTQSGATTPLWEQTVSAAAGSATTLVAASASEAQFQVYADDLNPLPLGKARFTAVHAIAGGPEVDLILADGRPVIPGLTAGTPAGTLDVPVFTYDFAVVPAGGSASEPLVTAEPASLDSGTSYTLVIYGTTDTPATLLLSAPTSAEVESGFVRAVHGVADAPAIDVYLNDTLAISALSFGDATEHIAVPAGTYDVTVRGTGSDAEILTTSVTVTAGQASTIAALGEGEDISAQVFDDDISGVTAEQARISLVNGIPGDATVSATLADGTSLGSDIAFGAAGEAVDIAPSSEAITLTTGDGSVELPAQTFYGGVYYNVFALDNAFVVAPTSLAQGSASAPLAGTTGVVAPPPVVEPTNEPAIVEATPEPTAAPEVAVQPTVPPTPEPTIPPQVTAVPVGPTGRVFNLNPDANLQLRQYPNTGALSLGTVPPATVLVVHGREGAIEPIPFSATPNAPEDYEFVDPVTLLADPTKDDLAPEQTWLFVTYSTPDGGSINAWANAQYIDVRNPRGERMRLAELPLVAGNTPGEAIDTAVTPPPVPVNRVAAVVFNLDAGVNLNIRRIPETAGEVLARVPNGTVMEFLGLIESGDWVFVSYAPPEGGTVTGWVDADYIQYTFNNRPIDLEEMETRELLITASADERGAVTAGVPQAAIPTANPIRDAFIAEVVLDPGSNLNLRRQPNANSEVLIQLPSGTQVVVNGRSEDANWLHVTFEETDGWIAARTDNAVFVFLTRNGEEVQSEDVPLYTGVLDTEATAEVEQTFENLPAVVQADVIAMTGSPGGDNQGLPILSRGQQVTVLFTDGTFSYIELPDGTRGWVPAPSVLIQ